MVQCTQPPPQLKPPESKITELTDDEKHDSLPKPEKRTRMHHIERHRSCVVTLSDIELNGLQPRRLLQTIEKSPGGGSQCSLHEETPTDTNASHRHAIADAAWEALKRSIVYFRGQPIGTVAAIDKSQGAALNYDQVFMRDFIPSALAFLMKGEHLIVKNFLVETACLQSLEKMVDNFKLGQGVMPASFKVHHRNTTQKTESFLADFGETAIGRVGPVDSGLWWIILLRAYTKWTGDNSLAESSNCQRAMHLILRLCLSEGCDTSPALLCAYGCSMIDRRMGIYGYPIEIQALFFMAMRCALSLLKQDSDADFVNHITKRIQALSYHLHSYYWLDFQRLNDIYRYTTEEYSQTALNKFNVIPEPIPDWIFDFMPSRGGYFIGNVSPARMDFRWFCLGNFIAILSSLTTGEQAEAILDLVEERWQELIGEMPLKICYPAMEIQEWQIVTWCDPKNTSWSYHNGGLWPSDLIRALIEKLAKMVQCTQPPPQLKLPESKITELIELNGLQPCRMLQTIEKSPGGGSQCLLREETPTDTNASHRHAIADAAWKALKRSIVYFRGQPIGTFAAIDKSHGAALNSDQVFMRDFIPSALAFLMKGEHLIVKNFLVETARLQSIEKMVDLFKLGQGVMPASFKVHHRNPTQKTESFLADFGETGIGRVAPIDSGLWWIILLRAYTKWTGDNSLAESSNCQRAMHLILRLCLSEGCDTSPALLCADGCSMIDRRMAIYGYPIEIQALFFMAMRCALSLLKQDSDADFVNHITKRIQALSYHLHSYYWVDFQRLNDIYCYKTEEYSQTALNKFTVIPESIPYWIFDFMPSRGGYFIGNVSPARMDFRWFCLGNFIAILSSLTTGEQAEAILDLVEERWQELVGEMPPKICYPAMENQVWQLATGYDQENTRWSTHNGGCESSDFSEILRKMNGFISIEENPSNCAHISLDSLDKFLKTYIPAIGKLRRFCEVYGIRKDLSDIGRDHAVFTTPPQGAFYFDVEYQGRVIRVVMNLRDLYIMGWSSPNGRFEMKTNCEARENFMFNPVKLLRIQKNYTFLTPKNEEGFCGVQNVLIGLPAWQLGFEGMYKSTCETWQLRLAIGTFAVHLAEAARIQSIFRDICVISDEYSIRTLDSRSKQNSLWVSNYGYYAREGMRHINTLSNGNVPEPINDCSTAKHLGLKISESEILSQIRILPRDACSEGVFKCHAKKPLYPSETDPVLKSPKQGWPKGRGGGGGGFCEGSLSSSLYLVEDIPPTNALKRFFTPPSVTRNVVLKLATMTQRLIRFSI